MSEAFFDGGEKIVGFKYEGDTPGNAHFWTKPVTHGGIVVEVGAAHQAREVNYNPQTRSYEMGEPKVWKSDGTPVMQRRVVVQTTYRDTPEDDGRRAWFFEQSKPITRAMMDAVSAVRGSGKSLPELGSRLEVTWTGNDPASYEGKRKMFSAVYSNPEAGGWSPPAPVAAPAVAAHGPWDIPAATPAPWQQPAPVAALPPLDPQLKAYLESHGVPTAGLDTATAEATARQLAAG